MERQTTGKEARRKRSHEFIVCFSLKRNLRIIGNMAKADKVAPIHRDQLSQTSAATKGHQAHQCSFPVGGHCAGGSASSAASVANSNRDIKVIHGLRTFAMIWIIFGHTIGLVSPEMMSKYSDS